MSNIKLQNAKTPKMSLMRQFPSLNTWIRALIIFVLACVVYLYMFSSKLGAPIVSEQNNTTRQINHVIQSLEESKQTNEELRELIDEFMSDQSIPPWVENLTNKLESKFVHTTPQSANEPSSEYERLRRRVRSNTEELWNYFSSELNKIKSNPSNIPELIDNALSLGAEHKRSLLSDIDHMRMLDGYEQWRNEESKQLSDLVQKRLHYLQNPTDCKTARKLVCDIDNGSGFGSEMHHLVYCFLAAYATERTLILKSKGWNYHKAGWEEVFHPLSDTCIDVDDTDTSHAENWPGQHDTQVVILPIYNLITPRPPFYPLAIPADLAPRLLRFHGNPSAWWVGQILKYSLRPNAQTQQMLDMEMDRLGFKKPIVGVHVRRTDKVGTEAAFHGIEEYMQFVEDYFLQLEINSTFVKRRIFLASDDPGVIDEARKKYPSYDIISDQDVARMAAVATRYTDSSLNGIIRDLHMLSLCDYLVCTLSSTAGRTAYELMQAWHPDASNRVKSVDEMYFYYGQTRHNLEVIIAHKPRNHDEIDMEPGDVVDISANHWNGFSKGKNIRTGQTGLFPSFKVIDKGETVELPTYPNAK